MRAIEFGSLTHEIRWLTGLSAKMMVHHLEHQLAEHWPGLSGPQYGVLRILECNPSTIRELSDRMMLAPSTLVPIVDRLESEGLIVRGKDPEDRRRTPLMLTEQGRQMLARVPTFDAYNHLSQALEAMGLEKSRQLSLLLQELVTHMAKDRSIVDRVLAMSARAANEIGECNAVESAAPPVK